MEGMGLLALQRGHDCLVASLGVVEIVLRRFAPVFRLLLQDKKNGVVLPFLKLNDGLSDETCDAFHEQGIGRIASNFDNPILSGAQSGATPVQDRV